MNTKLLLITLAGLCLVSTGCSVANFRNGEVKSEGPHMEKWHHNAAYSLMELSPVVNMGSLCPDKEWSMVTTKETLLTGLAGGVDEAVTAGLLKGAGVDVWNPQMIEWECSGGKARAPVVPRPQRIASNKAFH